MKVTIEQYLKAVEVIEKFHAQINEQINRLGKITISTFIRESSLLDKRTINALLLYTSYYEGETLDDINEVQFLKIRNAGKKSWQIFKEAREQYLGDKTN